MHPILGDADNINHSVRFTDAKGVDINDFKKLSLNNNMTTTSAYDQYNEIKMKLTNTIQLAV